MKNLTPKKRFFAILALIAAMLTSCSTGPEGPCFTIKGAIADADGKMLRIIHIGVDKATVVDSIELDGKGEFEFTFSRPECFDFYRLELDTASILVAIDSTETVTIKGGVKELEKTYTVEGSVESEKIKEINALHNALQEQVLTMFNSNSPAIMKTRNDILSLIDEFKTNLAKQYIASAPGSASAYYVMSLSLAGEPLFKPMTDRNDSKYLAAVATNMQHMYPETERTKLLVEFAQKAMSATRPAKEYNVDIKEESISTTGLFDISLPTMNGDSIRLSSLAGKVVLLDFTVYGNAKISSRNIDLRKLYSKYKEQGFEIYQISFDTDKHFWQTSASNLPWVCVRDGNGSASSNALLYNVQQIPTFYLINKENEIVLRDNQIKDLDKEIQKLLKE